MSTGNPLLVNYSLRHLQARKTQALLTVGGIALVVFVFAATLMLRLGLNETLATTGSDDNVMVIRTGAQNEIQSGIKREHAAIVLSQPEIARGADDTPIATADVLVLVSLKKRADSQPSNVNIRGVSPSAPAVREAARIVEGRLPTRGTKEVMVGTGIHKKFAGTDPGESLRIVGTEWPIVGIFDAGNSAFSSEIWGDVDVLMPSFRRDQFSSITARLIEPGMFAVLKERLENDKRLSLTVTHEKSFYESQSRALSLFITVIGSFVSAIFSLGAIIGAMITMYSAVSFRVREIGILRALGFRARTVFGAFLRECMLLGLAGGVLGLAVAYLLVFTTVTTTNFSTFSELAFGFRMTPEVAWKALLFAVVMGTLGGALPAFRASRLKIVSALRGQ